MKKLLAPLLVVLLLFTACAPAGNQDAKQTSEKATSEKSSSSEAESQTEEEASDDITVVKTAINAEFDSLDPWKSEASDTEAVMSNVFEGLLWYNESGDIVPVLAKSYEISEDGLTYTFKLRDDVKFHNGDAFDADDVIYSYDTLAGLTSGKPLSSEFATIENLDKIDDYTVAVTLKQKNAAFLAACIRPILPKGYDNQAQEPVGTGAFLFHSYEPGQKVVLMKNADYYNDERAAKVDMVEVYIMTEPTAIVNALLSGQLDFANIDPKNVAQLESEFDILSSEQNMVQLMSMNNKRAPFDNIKVRQAVNYAINKDQIIKAVGNGYGTKIATNMSPMMKSYYPENLNQYEADIEKAKSLLAEAGLADGFETSVTVPSNYKFHVDTAQVIANQLAQIGVKVEIKQVEWGVWLDEVYKQANYDMTIIGFSGKLNPNDILKRYHSAYKKNFINFNNAEFDKLLEEAKVEIDAEKRAELYRKAGEILNNEAPAVYIMDPHLVVAMNKNLTGLKFYPLRFIDFSSIEYR